MDLNKIRFGEVGWKVVVVAMVTVMQVLRHLPFLDLLRGGPREANESAALSFYPGKTTNINTQGNLFSFLGELFFSGHYIF